MTTIALIDDDRNILTSLSLALEAEGYQVRVYHDGEEGLRGVQQDPPDLAVLDVKMPRLDGFEVLARLREKSVLPVILLTSKDEDVDEILGLRLGADDYVTKPFSQRLLFERIRSVLRRYDHAQAQAQAQAQAKSDIATAQGALVMDDARYLASWHGRAVILTVTEYLILKSLAIRPGVVKTRDQLINEAYGQNIYVDDRIIDSHVKRLRKKFKLIDPHFNQIETLYGAGYCFKAD
jgi:two-component system response regulator ChvI